jgi:hypothetical protein
MDQQWPWWGIPRIFVRIGARASPEFGLLCAQVVACVVFFLDLWSMVYSL